MRAGIWFCLIAASGVGRLEADTLTYTVTPNASRFEYQLVLTNTGTTGGPLFDLFLSLPADIATIDTAAIGRPAGWGDPAGGLVFFGPDTSPSTSFIEWAADFSGGYDVGIGRSLSGFSFLASGRMGMPLRYSVNGSLDFGTAAEAAIPEPRVFQLMGLVVGVVGGCRLLATRKHRYI
jgi:hypothetical protein